MVSSADGQRLLATTYLDGAGLFSSTDGGLNWIQRESNADWTYAASSADGMKLVAASSGVQIHTSADAGSTWTAHGADGRWRVACSADDTKLVAADFDDYIYTSTATTTPGASGYLTGEQYSAIELQYIGNGQFLPLSSNGTISSY